MGLQADETTAATLLFVMFDLTPEGAKDEGVQQITERTQGPPPRFIHVRQLIV